MNIHGVFQSESRQKTCGNKRVSKFKNQMPMAEVVSGASVLQEEGVGLGAQGSGTTNISGIAVPAVALLTGGGDKPYVLGLVEALATVGIRMDLIASNALDCPQLRNQPLLNFLNLRGDQIPAAPLVDKAFRILKYYTRLVIYSATAKPRIFHVLWTDKFEFLDRTVLMLYYRLLGRRVVFTAHNVNAAKRDGNDTFINRLSLRIQYRLCSHIFVHTEKMKRELLDEFGIPAKKATVIPFGINNTLPNSSLSRKQARQRLGLASTHKVLLFFGRIAPYKGIEFLVEALAKLAGNNQDYRLVIAGSIKDCHDYWHKIEELADQYRLRSHLITKIGFIPDEEVELYFKAADLSVLPYTDIFQSGVLFLSYSFGLPVVATDVGSFREDIIEGRTGFVCKPRNSADLAKAIDIFFGSDLCKNLEKSRQFIREYANERYSWAKVGQITRQVYLGLAQA